MPTQWNKGVLFFEGFKKWLVLFIKHKNAFEDHNAYEWTIYGESRPVNLSLEMESERAYRYYTLRSLFGISPPKKRILPNCWLVSQQTAFPC